MEDEIFSPSSSSSDLSGSISTDEPLDVFIPESEIPEATDSFPPMFNPTPEIPQEYLDKAGQVWDTVSEKAEKVWGDITDTADHVWDTVTADTDTEQVPPDFYETLSPEDKETYDLLPNHGGLGRDPDDQGIY
ncbi:MAG: hypothetical protein WCA07_08260 [Gloeobacterales cyanobacterium]